MDAESMQAASVLCSFCARLFRSSLSQDDLAALRETGGLLREEPFQSVAPEAASTIAGVLDRATDGEEAEALYHELLQDYTYLFYQASLSRVSPYESVWRTDDQTLFGPTTLEVRQAYREAGFEVVNESSEPDDHLGTELEFIARLFDQAAHDVQEDAERAASAVQAARTFLSDHVLVFAPFYLEDFIQAASTPFYRAAGELTQRTLDAVAQATGAAASADIYRMP